MSLHSWGIVSHTGAVWARRHCAPKMLGSSQNCLIHKDLPVPELPEVETVCRGLAPHMEGATFKSVILTRKDLRFPFPRGFVKRLEGTKVEAMNRRAKYVLVTLSSGETLIMHLGMSGSYKVDEEPVKHEHVRFIMSNGREIGYADPRRFGFMDLAKTATLHEHKFFAKMGIEPLGNELSGAKLSDLFEGKKSPRKAGTAFTRAGLPTFW